MNVINLFKKPAIISIIADVNQGKSMLIHNILENLKTHGDYKLYFYGFRSNPNIKEATEIHSIKELETVRNSLIILDETMTLLDLNNRNEKKSIENTLRLINHNNNVLILCMLPENVKKFIAGKINYFFFKKCTIPDFVNGSRVKHIVTAYKGDEKGSEILNLAIDEALLFDGEHYSKLNVQYLKHRDSKADNKPIIKSRKVKK